MKVGILFFTMILTLLTFGCTVSINTSSSISFVPHVYNYGSVIVNDSKAKDFVIRNVSSKAISIQVLEITGAGKDSYSFISGGTYPINLLAGREHFISLKFEPSTEGIQTAKLSATFNSGQTTIEASLTGYGSVEAILDVDPTTYDFDDVGVGATVKKVITISNKGNDVLTIASLSIIDDAETNFNIADGALSSALELYPGNTHEVTVSFSPATTGSKSAKLSIEHDQDGSPFNVQLNGNGSNQISLSPSQHDFGEIEAGKESDYFTFTITNPTSSNNALKMIEVLGSYASSFKTIPSGSVNIAVAKSGGSAEVKVKFRPTKAGQMTATLKLTMASGTLSATLNGEGVTNPMIEIDPPSFDFGSVLLNHPIYKSFVITNTGSATLVLTEIKLQDDNDSSFIITKGGVPKSINPGATHTIEVKFNPTSRGDKAASIKIVHNAKNISSPNLIHLNGKGSEISLQPSVGNFGDVDINPMPIPEQSFTVTNNSTDIVTINKIEIIGVNASEFYASPTGTAGWEVNPNGGKYTIKVTCKPTSEGALSAMLQLTMSVGSPLQASLTANGVPNPVFRITPPTLDFGTIAINSSSSDKLYISNVGTGELKLSEIAIKDDAEGSFTITSGGLALGQPVISIAKGDVHEVVVKFAPIKHGQKHGKVHIAHNGVVSSVPYFDVNLLGTGSGPEFELIPMGSSYDFGHQIVGKTYRKSFYVRNVGDKDLYITRIDTTGGDFEFIHQQTTITVKPGHISDVEINFKPLVAGVRNGSIKFYHNSYGATYTVTLKGTGIDGAVEYYENFDGGSEPSGWGGTGEWEWGVQTINGPSSGHTGTKCWATGLNREYYDNKYCYLASATYDLSKMIAPKAEFWLWLDTVNYANYYKDGIWMEISTDGGNSWTRNVNPSPSYNNTVNSSIPAYVGVTSDGWEKITMDISSLAAGKSQVVFAWYFYSDNYRHSDGAFVDTFRVYDSGALTPHSPTPVDNDINVKHTASNFTLKWDSSNATVYDVYFGTSNPPTARVARSTPYKYHNVSVAVDRKYYWKVIATTANGQVEGPVWCFHTISSMPKVLINEVDTINSIDWVEIYNADTKAAHIGKWQFITYSDSNSYEDGTYILPDYIVLNPGEAIVIHDNQASGETYITEFNFNWSNSSSSGEVILKGPENYDNGVDYMKFNTLYSHLPTDLVWNGSLISNYTSYSNFYRRSAVDSDNATDWGVRNRTADKGSKNPGQ